MADLTAGILEVPAEIQVRDITLDSRAATHGSLFLACRGRSTHGLRFAEQAVLRGARAVLYEDSQRTEETAEPQAQFTGGEDSGVFVAAVPQLGHHVGTIADRFFGAPSQSLTIAGITGTNGKTTCAWLLARALQQLGRPCGYMGTLGYGVPPSVTPTGHTTPDVISVHRQLASLRDAGAECVCMEVTSHAIDQERINGVRIHTTAFTNLTHDHLDYHGTMAAYGAAKARLFDRPALTHRIINIDDAFGAALARQLASHPLVLTSRSAHASFSSSRDARLVCAVHATPQPAGLEIGIDSSWGRAQLLVPLVGDFNVENVLTVLAVLLAWQTPLSAACTALEQCRAPSGRMELFGGSGKAPLAIVDFAHTPDALGKALQAARVHCQGSLRVVFGCGGDRDASKRPVMGQLAERLADEVIITDDNPRSEDPARIVADILAGMTSAGRATIEHDRARAIQTALRRSRAGDVVLVAGKGHEQDQIYGAVRRSFRDQTVVAAELGVPPP